MVRCRYKVVRYGFAATEDEVTYCATRDFAVETALKLSKSDGYHRYVVDTGQVPYFTVGFAATDQGKSKFNWHDSIKTEYT